MQVCGIELKNVMYRDNQYARVTMKGSKFNNSKTALHNIERGTLRNFLILQTMLQEYKLKPFSFERGVLTELVSKKLGISIQESRKYADALRYSEFHRW